MTEEKTDIPQIPNDDYTEEKIKNLFKMDPMLKDLYDDDSQQYRQELRLQPEKAAIIRFLSYGLDKERVFKEMDGCPIGKWKERDDDYKESTYMQASEFVREKLKNKRPEKKHKSEYKTDGKFKPSLLAADLMKGFVFKTTMDDETLYLYNHGAYHDNGEGIVYQEAKRRYGEDITTHLAREVAFHIKTSTYVKRDEFNKFSYLVHLENGIFDLNKMELEPFTPDIISTVKIPIKYDQEADCSKIKQFLKEILRPDDVMIIQELIGYCLLKNYRFQKAFMFVGDGANGKSTLIELVKTFLGKKNVSSVELQRLETDRFAPAGLYGKLANLCADLSDKSMHKSGAFKMLTGGDMISAQKKFKEPFNFVNYAKLIFSANKLPEARDDSSAFFRRWIIIDFPHVFEGKNADKNIIKKITAEKELSGLFNWSIEGLKRLLTNGDFSYTLSTEEIRDQYKRMSSSLQAFVKDRVEVEPLGRIVKEDFYLEYIAYCKKYKLPIKAKNVVGADLPRFIYVETEKKKVEGVRKNCWIGIKVKKEDVRDVRDVNIYPYLNRTENDKELKYRNNLDNVDTLDTKKEEKVNKLGLWAINYLKNNKKIPKTFFVNETLKEFPNADRKQIEEYYDLFKQQEAERSI